LGIELVSIPEEVKDKNTLEKSLFRIDEQIKQLIEKQKSYAKKQ
jgi:hypothetical protein